MSGIALPVNFSGRPKERRDEYMIMTSGDASSLATRSREWVEEMISFMKRIDVELAQSGELVF